MTPEEITSLAREYAEFTDGSPADIAYIKIVAENAFRFLLRRFCLVEKSTIKEAWSMITGVYLDHDHITYDGARYLFYEMLFPEIGKEVEE